MVCCSSTALKMRGMAFQRHNYVKQLQGGMPTDPEGNVKHYTFRVNFPISVKSLFSPATRTGLPHQYKSTTVGSYT